MPQINFSFLFECLNSVTVQDKFFEKIYFEFVKKYIILIFDTQNT